MNSIMVMLLTFLMSTSMFSQVNLSYKASKRSNSEKRIKIRNDKDSKLNLKVNKELFDLELKYPKTFTSPIKRSFAENFSKVTIDTFKWEDENSGSSIFLKKNRIYVHIDKEQTAQNEKEKIENYINEVFHILDWDTKELGLWEYSGDWSLVK